MAIYYVSRKVLAKLSNSDPRTSKFRDAEPDALMIKENGGVRELFAIDIED